MNKGVIKSHVLSIPEGVHNCYRNRNVPWYKIDTKTAQYDKFLSAKQLNILLNY